MSGLFITGIGTGVGKTVVTAGLAGYFVQAGQSVCVYKPVQTGSPPTDPEDPGWIRRWCGNGVATANTYTFEEPAAPFVADLQREIKLPRLIDEYKALRRQYQTLLIEGAGGLRVPLTENDEMVDLVKIYQLPVLIVARPYLGAINHTLLSVESLLRRRIEVAGVVISGMPDEASGQATETFAETLVKFMEVPLLANLPEFELTDGCFVSGSPHLDKFQSLAGALSL